MIIIVIVVVIATVVVIVVVTTAVVTVIIAIINYFLEKIEANFFIIPSFQICLIFRLRSITHLTFFNLLFPIYFKKILKFIKIKIFFTNSFLASSAFCYSNSF